MSSPNIDSLFGLLIPQLPSCPMPLIRQEVKRTTRKMCRETGVWRVMLDAITVVDGTNSYSMPLPAGTELVTVLNVFAPGAELTPASLDEVAQILPGWRTAQGTPKWYNAQDFQHISVYPIPYLTVPGTTYVVRAALTPTLVSTDIDSVLATRYGEAIAEGAMATLKGYTEKPWSNPSMVPIHKKSFERACNDIKEEVLFEHVRKDQSVRPVPFGGTSRRSYHGWGGSR